MLAVLVLLVNDSVAAKVHNELKQLVFSAASLDNDFDSSTSIRSFTQRLSSMFRLQIRNHLLFGGLE